jgi:hypothetical protein
MNVLSSRVSPQTFTKPIIFLSGEIQHSRTIFTLVGRCNTLSLGSKLIIRSLCTYRPFLPATSVSDMLEDSSQSINQFNPKGSKYPIGLLGLID